MTEVWETLVLGLVAGFFVGPGPRSEMAVKGFPVTEMANEC